MNASKSALLVIDVQNDFLPGGSLAVNEGDKIVPLINKIRNNPAFSDIIFTSDWHPQDHISFAENHPGEKVFTSKTLPNGKKQEMWPSHCVQNTKGAEFHKDLVVNKTDVVIKKGTMKDVDSYSGFGTPPEETELEKTLLQREIKRVYVCGLATDFCVGATARDALKKGFETYLLLDCSKGIAEESVKSTIDELKKQGAFIINSTDI